MPCETIWQPENDISLQLLEFLQGFIQLDHVAADNFAHSLA
jgi:hypothetical protein